MATIVFMPFHWGIGFKSDFRLRRVLRNRGHRVRQTFNIELPVRVFVQVARPYKQR